MAIMSSAGPTGRLVYGAKQMAAKEGRVVVLTVMIRLIDTVTLEPERSSFTVASPWVLDNRGEVPIKEHCVCLNELPRVICTGCCLQGERLPTYFLC